MPSSTEVVVGGAGQSGLARRYRHTLEAGWMDRRPMFTAFGTDRVQKGRAQLPGTDNKDAMRSSAAGTSR